MTKLSESRLCEKGPREKHLLKTALSYREKIIFCGCTELASKA